ncbi:hypothetical protein VTL71DRAFT_10576 [Oculimacula yallundae]|uniref:Uncharacterized protein n=1 Tax=Oculimacula yallundae TaxID=86028 RepID=A0ABR4CTX2_9HELO
MSSPTKLPKLKPEEVASEGPEAKIHNPTSPIQEEVEEQNNETQNLDSEPNSPWEDEYCNISDLDLSSSDSDSDSNVDESANDSSTRITTFSPLPRKSQRASQPLFSTHLTFEITISLRDDGTPAAVPRSPSPPEAIPAPTPIEVLPVLQNGNAQQGPIQVEGYVDTVDDFHYFPYLPKHIRSQILRLASPDLELLRIEFAVSEEDEEGKWRFKNGGRERFERSAMSLLQGEEEGKGKGKGKGREKDPVLPDDLPIDSDVAARVRCLGVCEELWLNPPFVPSPPTTTASPDSYKQHLTDSFQAKAITQMQNLHTFKLLVNDRTQFSGKCQQKRVRKIVLAIFEEVLEGAGGERMGPGVEVVKIGDVDA